MTTLTGTDALSGAPLRLTFDGRIRTREQASGPVEQVFLAPGFFDLQVNGYAGVDYGSPFDTEALVRSIEAQGATGVTSFLATIITNSPEALRQAAANIAARKAEAGPLGDAVAGIHVEGPHISPEDGPRGAHPRRHVRPPSLDEFDRLQDAAQQLIRLVTLAPEWPGATAFIEALRARGVTVALGHTAATAQQIADAVSAGASLATHLGNATFPAPPKFHPLWDQLADDRLAASVIADGFHLPAAFLITALRTKSAGRLVLVTDAASPAGAAPGRYRLGEVEVDLHAEGRVTLAGGTRLAGSALRLDHAVTNMIRLAGASLAEAVSMATVNPRRLLGLPPGLNEGSPADFVEFTLAAGRLQIRRVWRSGKLISTAL